MHDVYLDSLLHYVNRQLSLLHIRENFTVTLKVLNMLFEDPKATNIYLNI